MVIVWFNCIILGETNDFAMAYVTIIVSSQAVNQDLRSSFLKSILLLDLGCLTFHGFVYCHF